MNELCSVHEFFRDFVSALMYGIIFLNLCEITGKKLTQLLVGKILEDYLSRENRCRSIACKGRYYFCLSDVSLKPILDNIHILKNIAHGTNVEYELLLFYFSFFWGGGVFWGFCWFIVVVVDLIV